MSDQKHQQDRGPKYQIGTRLRNYSKKYIKTLTCDLVDQYKVSEYATERIVPHITFLRPFHLRNGQEDEEELISIFNNILSSQPKPIFFGLNGFGIFRNQTPVFYAQVPKNPAIERMVRELDGNLSGIIDYKHPKITLPGEDEINLHVAVLSKGTRDIVADIEDLLSSRPFPQMTLPLLRVYLLKGESILREHDFYLNQSLNRAQATSPLLFDEKTLPAFENFTGRKLDSKGAIKALKPII